MGVDVPSFAEAIRRALRQDPDVILVGEMRDLETIEAAITAAETGHIVFGTLHTTGAQGTVNRIIDVFPTNQQEQIRTQLSTSIIGVLSQALLPQDRRRPRGRLRDARGHAGHRQPDPREQDVPHHLGHPDRAASWACSCWTTTCSSSGRRASSRRSEILIKANNPDELAAKIARAERGMFEDEDEARGRDGEKAAGPSQAERVRTCQAFGDREGN